MKATINNLLYWAWFIRHGCVTLWRVQTGRWHVFRDRPRLFVEQVADMQESEVRPHAHQAAILNMIRQAREELALRQRREGDDA